MITLGSLCAAVAGLFLIATPAYAAEPPPLLTLATGLDSPRGLAFGPHGELYVAEAGRGGAGPCRSGLACAGRSGAITRIAYGRQQRILTNLPSVAAPGGTGAVGPSDVAAGPGGGLYYTVGADRRTPSPGAPGLYRDGQAITAQAANPAAVLAVGRDRLLVDAGSNALLRVGPRGRILTVATFPRRSVPAPAGIRADRIAMDPVPSSVARGPDGAFYVGELTGFPFPPGQARIWRVEPGRAPQVYASGLTAVTDLAWASDGRLYALSGGRNGALLRVSGHGPHHVVASAGLTAPGGLAIRGRHAYVTNCGVCRGTGSVVRIEL
ncbi:ScyD/ScyE family protein [Actinoplanes sp. NBC_00393]|uniref:ScyD/ScyE family protein n=1 Tax=Actinoplanes sp. NBC_00393 TaxID=2975953 RepID=UPI002E216F77